MGTKLNPGKYDCHAKAADDEPTFTLLGRDRHAAYLVLMWAMLRRDEGEDPAKVQEAMVTATAMEQYRVANGKRPMNNQALANVLTRLRRSLGMKA